MADWVDSLSDAEVKALYKYKQQGVDSLTDDEVRLMHPHKDKLLAQPKPEEPSPILDTLTGIGQAAATTITGGIGGAVGWIPAALQKLNDPKNVDFEKQYAENMNSMTYEPTREKGTEYANVVGEFFNRNVIPVAPMLPHMPTVGKVLNAGLRDMTKVKAGDVSLPKVDSHVNAIIKGEEKAPVDPNLELYKQAALEKEQQAIAAQQAEGQKPIFVNKEGEAAKNLNDLEIQNQTSTEGLNKQQSLFDQHEESVGRPNQFNAEPNPQGWRVDENGIPFRADLSMEAANLENPLQRNLFGDELGPALEQDVDALLKADTAPKAPETAATNTASYAALQQEKHKLLGITTKEAKVRLKEVEAQLQRLDVEFVIQREHEQKLAKESAFNQEQPTVLTPWAQERQASARVFDEMQAQLRNGEQSPVDTTLPRSAIPDVVKGLKQVSDNERVGAAQKQLNLRQTALEQDVARQGGLDFNAAERARQEAAGFREPTRTTTEPAPVVSTPFGQEAFGKGEQVAFGLKDATANLFDALAEATGTKFNFMEGTPLREALKTFTRALYDAGHTTYLKAVSIARESLGAKWEQIKGAFKEVWDEHIGSKKDTPQSTMKFGDKEKVDFLKNTPLGKRLGDVGHAMIKSADEAIQLAKDVKDVSQNYLQSRFNYLSKGGTYLKGRLDHPVVHYTIDRMLEGHDIGKGIVQDLLHANYLPALRDLTGKERVNVFTMLNHADLTQTILTKERMDAAGVPPREQAFVLKHQELMAKTLEQINEARVAVGKKPIQGRDAYSALNMSGIHRKVVYKMLPNAEGVPTRQVVGVIGADTMNVGKHSLNNLEKMLKEKDPALEFGGYQDMSKGPLSAKGTPHEAFLEVLKTIGENDPKYAEFLNTLKEVAKDDPSNYMGMQKHTLNKKGVWGMEGRKQWLSPEENAKQFFENQVKYAESALTWGPMAKAAMDVNKVLRDEGVVTKHKNAVGISEAYMQNALGLNPNEFGQAVTRAINVANKYSGNTIKPSIEFTRQFANTMMMSLSPSFLAIQLVQPLAASPAMAMFLKGRGMEGSFANGVVKTFQTNLKAFQDKPLSAFEKDMFKYMEDRHVASADMIEKSNQIEKNAKYWTNWATQHPGALVESVTRKQVFMSLSHMLKDSGLTKETGLFEQAQRFTDMAMNNMAQLEKPAGYHIFGPLGSMAYNLKSFSHNELSRLSMYARELAKTGNAAPLLTQLATTITLAGVMGLPFYSQFESLFDFITEQTGNPKSLTMEIMKLSEALAQKTSLGEKGLYALSHGGLSAAGVDVSKRIGLGDVLPSHAADAAFAGGTKVLDMAKSAAMLAAHSTDPDYQRYAAQTLAPPFLQGPLDIAFSPEGQALKKDPTKKPELMAKRTEGDVLAKKMGLTGIHESVERQKTYQNDRIDKVFKDIANSAMVSIYQDIRHGRPIREEMVDKFVKVGQGDPQMMEKNIQSFAENMNLTVSEQRLLKDNMSKRIPQLRSLERRTQ